MTFLVADDAQHVRDSLRVLLELEAGWQVVGEAADGRQALALAWQLRPDVVLLDANLPGVEVMPFVRRLRALAQPPAVVLLTTYDAPDARTQAGGIALVIAKGEGALGLLRTLRAHYGSPAARIA